MLVGIAAAIKLTPLIFVLFFLLRGQRRAALTAGVSFLCATAAGFLLSWSNSVRFWTEQMLFGAQSRGMSNQMNQSLKVMLVRLGSEGGALWLLLAGAVLIMTAVGMRRAFVRGRPTWALGLNALCGATGVARVVLTPLGLGSADPSRCHGDGLAYKQSGGDRCGFRPGVLSCAGSAVVVGRCRAVDHLALADRQFVRHRSGDCDCRGGAMALASRPGPTSRSMANSPAHARSARLSRYPCDTRHSE
jgi:hypothetical protein